MKKYVEEAGNLMIAAILSASAAGLVFRALSPGGGIWLIVSAFETAICGGQAI